MKKTKLSLFMFATALAGGLVANINNSNHLEEDYCFCCEHEHLEGHATKKSANSSDVKNRRSYQNLKEAVITFNGSNVTISDSDAGTFIDNKIVLTKTDEYIYTLTGDTLGKDANISYCKARDEECTVYLRYKNLIMYNNNWGGIPLLADRYVVYDDDGNATGIQDTFTPIHYVIMLEGENIFAGHNHGGFGVTHPNSYENAEITVQFMTEVGGSLAACSTYPNNSQSIPVNDDYYMNEFIPTDSCSAFTTIKVGNHSNLNQGYNTTKLKDFVNNGTYKEFTDHSYEGFMNALEEQYPKPKGAYSKEAYPYNIFYISMSTAHMFTTVSGYDATCISNGQYDHYRCQYCNCEFHTREQNQPCETDISKFTFGPNPDNHSYEEYSEIPATCTSAGCKAHYECYRCHKLFVIDPLNPSTGYIEVQQEDLIIPMLSHNYVGVVTTMPTTETEGVKTFTCTNCGDSYTESIPVIIKDNIEEATKQIVQPTESSGITVEEIEETIEALSETEAGKETLITIVTTLSDSTSAIADMLASGDITSEQAETYAEIVNIVGESTVIIAADADVAQESAKALNESIPESADLDMQLVYSEFYGKVIAELLGQTYNPKPVEGKIAKRAIDSSEQKSIIDFGVSLETYQNAMLYADTSVANMAGIAGQLRQCSGEKISIEVKEYISTVKVSSFRDFDKEAADAEFAEQAYKAVLVKLQETVLANLESEYDQESERLTGTAKEEFLESYSEQVEAVNDIEEFEIMIIEIMRQKYVSVLNTRLDADIINEEEYSNKVTVAQDVDLFKPVYKDIFTEWALQKPSQYGITLEELTTAAVAQTSIRQKAVKSYRGSLTGGEKTLIAIFCLGSIAAVVALYLNKKKVRA